MTAREPERQQANSWNAVWQLRSEIYPGLLDLRGSGCDKALAAIRDLSDRAARSEIGTKDEWTWSLDQPEVSGSNWIETWDETAMELGVRRFTVGDVLPPNVAAWRYVEPPRGARG